MFLVTGATGPISTSAIKALIRDGKRVRVLARDPKKASFAGAEIMQGDLSKPETLDAAFAGIEAAFLVTSAGPDMTTLHEHAIAAAKKAKVKKMVKVSAWGATPQSPASLGKWHAKTDQALRDSGLQWVVLQPHGFMQNTLGYAANIKGAGKIFAPLGKGHVCYIDSRDLGEVGAKVLAVDTWNYRDLELTGPTSFSYTALAKSFSEVLGKSVEYIDVPQETARQAMLASGLPAWLVEDLLILSGFYAADYASKTTSTVEEVLGYPGKNMAQFIGEHQIIFG
jgi:(4-alkanoyl-5-oxo-2,5-dihydrofuran-3-yl)methyl phosphate reductase